jgi:hypothetical protein
MTADNTVEMMEAAAVGALVKAITPLLRGFPSEVQGAALADLLAMWLAGHLILGDPKKTEAYRESVLELHLEAVRQLIPVNYAMNVEPQLKEHTQ